MASHGRAGDRIARTRTPTPRSGRGASFVLRQVPMESHVRDAARTVDLVFILAHTGPRLRTEHVPAERSFAATFRPAPVNRRVATFFALDEQRVVPHRFSLSSCVALWTQPASSGCMREAAYRSFSFSRAGLVDSTSTACRTCTDPEVFRRVTSTTFHLRGNQVARKRRAILSF